MQITGRLLYGDEEDGADAVKKWRPVTGDRFPPALKKDLNWNFLGWGGSPLKATNWQDYSPYWTHSRSSTAHIGSYSASCTFGTYTGGHFRTYPSYIATKEAIGNHDEVIISWYVKSSSSQTNVYDVYFMPLYWNGSSLINHNNTGSINKDLPPTSSWTRDTLHVTDATPSSSEDVDVIRMQFQSCNVGSSKQAYFDDIRIYSSANDLPPCGHAKVTNATRISYIGNDDICYEIKYQSDDTTDAWVRLMYEDPDDGLYYWATTSAKLFDNVTTTNWYTKSSSSPATASEMTSACESDLVAHHEHRILARVWPHVGDEVDHINEVETVTMDYTNYLCGEETR